MATPVTKIYELRTLGFESIHKDLQAISKDFENIRKAKREAEKGASQAKSTEEARKYREEVQKLKIAEQELRVQRQQMINDQKAENIARQTAINQEKDRRKALVDTSGWYGRLTTDIRELGAAIKSVQNIGDPVTFRNQTFSYDQAIAKLKELTAAEQDFRRQFARDQTLVGEYTTGIIQAFKQMGLDDLVAGQITKAQQRLRDLNQNFDQLQAELRETQAAGQATDSIEKQMIENRNEVIKLDTELARLRADLRGTGDVGSQITTSIANGFKSAKSQLQSLLFQYVGLQAAINQAQAGVSDARVSSDQFTDLEIQLGNSTEAANNLNDALRKFDTRTTVIGLQQIADIALRAGTTAQNIEGVTRAIDIAKTAFGKDFGSVEQGTEILAKLINIFFDDGQITEERILQIANAQRTLANETVASVPFLNDFAQRMAGLRQIAAITLPDVVGLGAGFQEFGQSAEVASTVLVKIIPKLAEDTAKYAQIVGLTQDQFSELINNNPAEALIRVSEALVNSGEGIEEISKALADSELGSGRITTIIGALGGNADVFRQRISRAGVAMQETGAITDAFNKKNNNLAATLDKLSKKATDFFAGKTFQTALAAILAIFTGLIAGLPVIIGLVALLTVNWIAQNAALLAVRAQLLFYNAAIGFNLILINALRVANIAYIATMFLLNGAYAIVTRAAALFNIQLRATPLGIILTGIGLLITAFKAFGGGLGTSARLLDDHNQKLRLFRDVAREAQRATVELRAQASLLAGVVRDLTISEETRIANLKKLIEIDPVFQKALKDGKINYDELNKSLETYNNNLIRTAELEAARAIQARETQKLQDLSIKKTDLETAISTENFKDLDAEMRTLVLNQAIRNRSLAGQSLNVLPSEKDMLKAAREVVINLENGLQEQSKKIELAQQVFNEKLKQGDEAIKATVDDINKDKVKVEPVEVDIPSLQKDIDDLDKLIKEFKGSQKELDKLIADRARKQEQLDKALGVQRRGREFRGSRLSGETKDVFKDIEAFRDEELARLNTAFIQQTQFQRRLQERLRITEEGKIEIVRQYQDVAIRDEEEFLLESLEINTNAIDRKLAALKGANAEERKQIAQLNLEKINLERETNNKIFDLRSKALKDVLDTQIADANEQAKLVQNDPSATELEKLQAQLNADRLILDATIRFNQAMDLLEKDRNDISKKNAEDRARELREIQNKLTQDEIKILQAELAPIREAGEKQITEYEINFVKLRRAILNNDKLTASQRKRALENLNRLQNVTILSAELAQLTLEFENIKKQYALGLKTDQEYLDAKLKMEKKAAEQSKAQKDAQKNKLQTPSINSLQELFTDQLSKSFGFGDDSEETRVLGDIIAQGYELAMSAMTAFYEAERQEIQRTLDLQLERLDTEKQQVLSRAESQAEIESIERQYAEKKRAAERAAGEQLKKNRRAEAKIALATELANIAVQSSQYPFPANLVILALLSGLAIGRYAIRVNEINSQKFEKGGQVPTRKGGKIKGPSHKQGGVKFNYEAEGEELAIINKKSARDSKVRTITGTNKQIASKINELGGGVSFASGAKIRKFESGGFIGQRLEAPTFRPASTTFAGASIDMSQVVDKLDEVIESNRQQAEETSRRIDRLEVVQVTSTVTAAQSKQTKQSNIGTL